jgi:hypothetical protein
MPRSSSRGGFSSRGPTRSSFAASRPTYAQTNPVQQPTMTRAPGMFSGLGSTLATGMAFGAGS